MRTFSKSKLLALRQCPKRLWLEVHRPELRDDSAATQASFQVGDVARRIYDPNDGSMRFSEAAFLYLPLEKAMLNAAHDEPGFWDRWAQTF